MTDALGAAGQGSNDSPRLSRTGRPKVVPADPWLEAGISCAERARWVQAGVSDIATVLDCEACGLGPSDMATAFPQGGNVVGALDAGLVPSFIAWVIKNEMGA